jgi:hypothetical protein
MRNRHRVFLAALCRLLILGIWTEHPGAQKAAASQSTIAHALLSDAQQERYDALEQVRAIPAPQVGPELRAALIGLLDKQNTQAAQALERGQALADVESPEFRASVQRTVAALRDPASIPSLAKALGLFTLIEPLAEFGERAVPAVVEVVTSPRSSRSAVDDGLRVLRMILERSAASPLSPASQILIRRAAQQRLNDVQMFTTLWYAIDLAAATGDPELRVILQDLATNSVAVTSRGVTTPHLVEQTQRRAAERLGR